MELWRKEMGSKIFIGVSSGAMEEVIKDSLLMTQKEGSGRCYQSYQIMLLSM